jgi:CO/xanthine dehydrogenase Mo-binding subunit
MSAAALFERHQSGRRRYRSGYVGQSVSAVDNGSPIRGIDKPRAPPAAPALANAIFAATGSASAS